MSYTIRQKTLCCRLVLTFRRRGWDTRMQRRLMTACVHCTSCWHQNGYTHKRCERVINPLLILIQYLLERHHKTLHTSGSTQWCCENCDWSTGFLRFSPTHQVQWTVPLCTYNSTVFKKDFSVYRCLWLMSAESVTSFLTFSILFCTSWLDYHSFH
jgi:hypothetical protein